MVPCVGLRFRDKVSQIDLKMLLVLIEVAVLRGAYRELWGPDVSEDLHYRAYWGP